MSWYVCMVTEHGAEIMATCVDRKEAKELRDCAHEYIRKSDPDSDIVLRVYNDFDLVDC